MAEHYVSVMVQAPVKQVYTLFTHFNDFPKFMRFIKEVTYLDDQRSHWVAQVGGRDYEWDAINEDWIPEQQVGWRSVEGLENTGRVKFMSLSPQQTRVYVYISYTPPAGILGAAAEKLGMDTRFQAVLEEDMRNFARMVEEAPPGALDPMSSHYLFHKGSAVERGETTRQQQEAMAHDPMMSQDSLRQRDIDIEREKEIARSAEQHRQEEERRHQEQIAQARAEQESALRAQRQRDREEAASRQGEETAEEIRHIPDPVYDTIGGRNAAMANTAFGDLDARGERFPNYSESPMRARASFSDSGDAQTPVEQEEESSPWRSQIRGQPFHTEEEGQRPQEEKRGPNE